MIGELLGELAGTPVHALLDYAVHPVTNLRAGPAPAGWPAGPDDAYDRLALLDPLVEAVGDPDPWPMLRSAEAGQELLSMLDAPRWPMSQPCCWTATA